MSTNTINVTEDAQTYPLVVRANVDCKISIPGGITWVSDITTKALTDKTFTLNIAENEDYSSRSVIITVSDTKNKINQTITLTQAGYTPVYITIPDPVFLSCLVDSYDINGDSMIDQKEASRVITIDCSKQPISSLRGIEYFTNLSTLDCSKTSINALDISANTKLTSILCQYNELMDTLSLPPITTISDRAFVGCTALKELDLPSTISHVGQDAFAGCSNMNKVTIRSDIGCTYMSSFAGAGITDVYVVDNATVITKEMFSRSPTLGYIKIGENVVSVEQDAFKDCVSLYSVVFKTHSKLKRIESGAFAGAIKLKRLDMSKCQELSYIDNGSQQSGHIFYSHSNSPLLNIYLGTLVPPIVKVGFYELYRNNNGTYGYNLFVPSESIAAYKNSTYWYKTSSNITISEL